MSNDAYDRKLQHNSISLNLVSKEQFEDLFINLMWLTQKLVRIFPSFYNLSPILLQDGHKVTTEQSKWRKTSAKMDIFAGSKNGFSQVASFWWSKYIGMCKTVRKD